jgi:Niemann-Pick C2 protein
VKMETSSVLIGCFLFVSLLSGIDCISWKSCDESGRGKVTAIRVAGCENVPVCSMKRGYNASISIDFVINEDTTSAKSVVHGIVAGIPVSFPLPNPDACKDSGVKCPLKKGTTYTYSTIIPIKKEYPCIKLVVKWELQDQNSKDIFCIEMPVAIVDGVKSSANTINFQQKL